MAVSGFMAAFKVAWTYHVNEVRDHRYSNGRRFHRRGGGSPRRFPLARAVPDRWACINLTYVN